MWNSKIKLIFSIILVAIAVFLVYPEKQGVHGYLDASKLNFDRPKEFIFRPKNDDRIDITLNPQIKNLVAFSGELRVYKNLNLDLSRYHYYGQTTAGAPIHLLTYGDAGGLLKIYSIQLTSSVERQTGIVQLKMFTDTSPVKTIKPSDMSDQKHQLENLFETVVNSVKSRP